jgi:hypothetical protein
MDREQTGPARFIVNSPKRVTGTYVFRWHCFCQLLGSRFIRIIQRLRRVQWRTLSRPEGDSWNFMSDGLIAIIALMVAIPALGYISDKIGGRRRARRRSFRKPRTLPLSPRLCLCHGLANLLPSRMPIQQGRSGPLVEDSDASLLISVCEANSQRRLSFDKTSEIAGAWEVENVTYQISA